MNIRLRASSLADLMDCAMRWEGIHLMGITSPTGFRAHLGKALHHGANIFDGAKFNNEQVNIEDGISAFVNAFKKPESEIDWRGVNRGKLEVQGIMLTRTYCADISPRYNYIAVEERMPEVEAQSHGITITLTGQVDRLQRYEDAWGVVDLKSTARPGGDYRAQLAVYQELGAARMGTEPRIEAGVIEMRTQGEATVEPKSIPIPHGYLLGDGFTGEEGLLDIAARMLKQGVFPPNPRSNFCHPDYCPRYKISAGSKGYCKYKR